MSALIEVVDELQPALRSLHQDLIVQYRHLYKIDYSSLGFDRSTDLQEIVRFKNYIDEKLNFLLRSHHLIKNGTYIDDSFSVKSSLVQFKRAMSFDEFIMDNLLQLYPFNLTLNEIYADNGPLKSRALRDKSLVDAIEKLKNNAKLSVESFDKLEESLSDFNFNIYEDYTCNRDKWSNDRVYKSEMDCREAKRLRAKLKDAFIKLQKRVQRTYELDDCDVSMICRPDSKDFDIDRTLSSDLNNILRRHSLTNKHRFYDDDFYLTSTKVDVTDIMSFKQFIDSNLSGLLSSEFFNELRIESDTNWYSYVDNCFNTELNNGEDNGFDALREFIESADSVIIDFDNFEIDLRDLARRVSELDTALTNAHNTIIDDDYASQISELSRLTSGVFHRLKWRLASTHRIRFKQLKDIKGLSRTDLDDFKEDVNARVDILLTNKLLKKDKIAKFTKSFALKPIVVTIEDNSTLQDFLELNFNEMNPDTMFIHDICSISDRDLAGKILDIRMSKAMTDQEIRNEFKKLIDFIETVKDVNQSFNDVRREINEINASMVEECMQMYCKAQED